MISIILTLNGSSTQSDEFAFTKVQDVVISASEESGMLLKKVGAKLSMESK